MEKKYIIFRHYDFMTSACVSQNQKDFYWPKKISLTRNSAAAPLKQTKLKRK